MFLQLYQALDVVILCNKFTHKQESKIPLIPNIAISFGLVKMLALSLCTKKFDKYALKIPSILFKNNYFEF